MASADPIDAQFKRYLETKAPKDLAPIFQTLAPKLMAASRRAGLDDQGSEEVVQETFLALIEAEDRFDPARPFLPWLHGIALRQIRAERRRRARLHLLLKSDGDEPLLELVDERPEANLMAQSEFRQQVSEAIQTLSEANQVVVKAALIDGLSNEEISASTGLSKGAVAVRLHRGLDRLRQRLSETLAPGLIALVPSGGRGLKEAWNDVVERAADAPPKATSARGFASGSSTALVAAAAAAIVGGALWLVIEWNRGAEEPDTVVPTEPAQPLTEPSVGQPQDLPSPVETSGQRTSLDSQAIATAAVTKEEPSAKVTVGGRVVLRDYSPGPAGVRVILLESNPGLVLPDEPLNPAAVTATGGSYELPIESFAKDATPILIARFEDEIAWADVPSGALEEGELPVLRLTPELVVEVSVEDTLGRPMDGVQLAAWTQSKRFMTAPPPGQPVGGFIRTRPYFHLFGAVTDEQGQGRIRSLYGADSPGLVTAVSAWREGFACATKATRLLEGRLVEMTFVLQAVSDLALSGVILDPEGAPVPGAEITFKLRGESDPSAAPVLTTNASGEWRVPERWLDDYPINLRCTAAGFSASDLLFEQAENLPAERVRVQLGRAKGLGGQVVDERGAPIAGANVRVATAPLSSAHTTDEEGRFECTVPTGTPALISVRSPLASPARRAMTFPIGADTPQVRLTLEAPATSIDQLSIRLPAELKEEVWREVGIRSVSAASFEGHIVPEELRGREARFTNVPAGRWLAYGVTNEGTPLHETINISGADISQKVVLSPPARGGTLEGHIASQPIIDAPQCMVLLRRTSQPRLPTWMSRTELGNRMEISGRLASFERFRLPQLEPGEWEVFVRGEGWCTEPRVVEITPKGVARIDLEPVESTTVQLVSPKLSATGIITVEGRLSADAPWRLVAIDTFSSGEETTLRVGLPSRDWHWRASMQTADDRGRFVDVFPTVYGAGSEEIVRLIAADLTVPQLNR